MHKFVALLWMSLGALLLANLTMAVPTSGESTCLNQCATNYTYPARPPTACCGCCDASNGDTCNGNGVEFSTCCRANEDFCGCISARAFCNGYVYNGTYPVESAFGTCYPKGYGTCTYNPGPNLWIVCPTGLTGCIGSNNIASCCRSDQTCNNIDGTCSSATTTTPPPSSPNDCGCVISTDQCCHDQATGKRCYNPSLYSCTTNNQGQSVLCSAGSSSCGLACYNPSQYCCQNGNLQPAGSCSGGSGGSGTCNGKLYDTATQFCCTALPSYGTYPQAVCPKGQHCCGGILNGTSYYNSNDLYTGCYDPAVSKCCYGGTSAYVNPSVIQPLSYQPSQGSVQQCTV